VASDETKVKKGKTEAPIRLKSKPKEPISKEIPAGKDEGVKIRGKRKEKFEEKALAGKEDEHGKKIVDQRGEGKGKHTKIEGKSHRGFVDKIFRRKSG
jgi:hypothetical protein